jgi:hypothetical protein
MSDKPLPKKLRRRYQVDAVAEMWRKRLTEGNVRTKHLRHLFGMLPSNPRCVNCHAPFAGFGSTLLRLIRGPITQKSPKNPRPKPVYFSNSDKSSLITSLPGGIHVDTNTCRA